MFQSEDTQLDTSPSVKPDNFSQLWASLGTSQQKYAIARLHTGTDTEAAQEAGVKYDTVTHWKNKRDVDQVVRMMIANARDTAMGILETGLVEAAIVKLTGMRETSDKRLAQEAASEIMDRVIGKPTQRIAPVMPDGTTPYGTPTTDADLADRLAKRLLELGDIARARRIAAEQGTGAIVQPSEVRIVTLPIDTPNE